MPHFSFQHLNLSSISPKNVRNSLRLRRQRKSSSASQDSTDFNFSSSNISIASSNIYRRRSVESITSTSTAASSAIVDHSTGLVSLYYVPTNIIKSSPKGKGKLPQRKNTGGSTFSASAFTMTDLCGFHHSSLDNEEESFSPELILLEPRPTAPRYCGFMEALEQRPSPSMLRL